MTYFGDAALLHEHGTVNHIAVYPFQSGDGRHINLFGIFVKDAGVTFDMFINHLYSNKIDFYYTNTLMDEANTRRLKTGLGDELFFFRSRQGFKLHKSFSVVF